MTDTSWTKGPWVWQDDEECLVGPHQIVMRQDDEGRKVFADYPDGTTQANARLIAAAPDMAEALVSARETILHLIHMRGSEAEGTDADWVAEIDAALARSKGATT